jgi:protein TonB
MKRILVSALVAVLIHGTALFFLPFSAFVPGTVSPKDHGIAIQITHPAPEPEKKADPAPASDIPPVPRPEEQQPPVQKQLPEKKQSPEPDIETPPPPEPDIDINPDPVEITAKKDLMPKKEDLTLSETGKAPPPAAGMTASTDKTPVAKTPNDRNPSPDLPHRKEAVPLYKENPPPRYPGNARRRGYTGTVLLMVFVTEKGVAEQIRVVASSGHDSLDRAAAKAVADWRFEPGTSDGIPTGMWVKIPITYELKK